MLFRQRETKLKIPIGIKVWIPVIDKLLECVSEIILIDKNFPVKKLAWCLKKW